MSSNADTFQLLMHPPKAGWVRVEVTASGKRHILVVSYLSDAIGEFVQAVAGLASRQCKWGGESIVDWEDEPGAWRWRLTPLDGSLRVQVDQHSDVYPSHAEQGSLVFEMTICGRELCSAVLGAMDGISQQMTPAQFEEAWGYAFPTESTERLRAALRAWKS